MNVVEHNTTICKSGSCEFFSTALVILPGIYHYIPMCNIHCVFSLRLGGGDCILLDNSSILTFKDELEEHLELRKN